MTHHKTVISCYPGVHRQTGTKMFSVSWRRKVVLGRSSCSFVGNVFHTHDLLTEKAPLPIRRRVRVCAYLTLAYICWSSDVRVSNTPGNLLGLFQLLNILEIYKVS